MESVSVFSDAESRDANLASVWSFLFLFFLHVNGARPGFFFASLASRRAVASVSASSSSSPFSCANTHSPCLSRM